MRVHVVVMRPHADRVLPRWARYMNKHLGWTYDDHPNLEADVNFLVNYADGWSRYANISGNTAAWFTHYDPSPPKATLWDRAAHGVALRVTQCRLYEQLLTPLGRSAAVGSPVELRRFSLRKRLPIYGIIGMGGYVVPDGRKGEALIGELVKRPEVKGLNFVASGRGWPVTMTPCSWAEMPSFYHRLSAYVCPSLVEGGPLGPLEALACGVPVVIPWGVGMMDELPETAGVRHYRKGDVDDMTRALMRVLDDRYDPAVLRDTVSSMDVPKWCRRIGGLFEEVFGGYAV